MPRQKSSDVTHRLLAASRSRMMSLPHRCCTRRVHMKRSFVPLVVATVLAAATTPAFAAGEDELARNTRFDLLETTIPEIRRAQQINLISAERLTQMYLKRIEAFEEAGPGINAY